MPRSILKLSLRTWLVVCAALLVVYAVFGFFVVPRIVRAQLASVADEFLQRRPSVGDIRFNPFTLTLEVDQLAMADAANAPLFGAERLMVNIDISSVWRRGLSLADVELTQPYAHLEVRPGGALNFSDLLRPRPPQPKPKQSGPPPRIFIDRFVLASGRVRFVDRARATPVSTEIAPIGFVLNDFTTVGAGGSGYALRASTAAGENFAWQGSFTLVPFGSRGTFSVNDLQVRTLWSYVRDLVAFEPAQGTLKLDGGYELTSGEGGTLKVDVSNLGIAGLALRPQGGASDYVELGSIGVHDAKVNLATRRVDVARVAIAGGVVRVRRDGTGSLNLLELARRPEQSTSPAPDAQAPVTPASEPAPPEPDAHPWVVAAPDLAITGLDVELEDALVQPAAKFTLTPFELKATGYSTAPDAEVAFEVHSNGTATGEIGLTGKASPATGALAAHVTLGGVDLTSLQSYLSTYTQTTLKSGVFQTSLDITRTAAGALTAKGDISSSRLHLIDNALKQDLVKWEELSLAGFEWGSQPAHLKIARVTARAPYARLIVAPDQTLNITRAFKPTPGAAPAAVQTVRDTAGERHAPGGNPGALRIAIGAVKIVNGSANFADFWITPNYAVSVQELNGGITGLSSDPASRAKVDLKGKVDRYAPAAISGELNVLSAALFTDMHVKFDGVEMTSVTPYSGRFAGYRIEKGKLSIDVAYHVENRKLTATQRFVIDQLELGEKVESPDAVHLPLKIAVALLKDRNGVIDIDLPLTGSLDDPQFRIGPLVWKAFVGLLGKIATSPFALLGKLAGRSDEINKIEFAPGAGALEAAQAERVAAVAKALGERPALSLEIPAIYAEVDAHALALAQLAAQIPAAASADAAMRFTALYQQYQREFGKAGAVPEAVLAVEAARKQKGVEPPYAAASDVLTNALLAKHPAVENDLEALARSRAQGVRDALVVGGGIDPARIYLLGVDRVAEPRGPVVLELRIK